MSLPAPPIEAWPAGTKEQDMDNDPVVIVGAARTAAECAARCRPMETLQTRNGPNSPPRIEAWRSSSNAMCSILVRAHHCRLRSRRLVAVVANARNIPPPSAVQPGRPNPALRLASAPIAVQPQG